MITSSLSVLGIATITGVGIDPGQRPKASRPSNPLTSLRRTGQRGRRFIGQSLGIRARGYKLDIFSKVDEDSPSLGVG